MTGGTFISSYASYCILTRIGMILSFLRVPSILLKEADMVVPEMTTSLDPAKVLSKIRKKINSFISVTLLELTRSQ